MTADAKLAALREQLRDLRGRAGLTMSDLHVRSRLGRTTVSQALNDGASCPSWVTVAALAKAMKAAPSVIDALHELWKEAQPSAPRSQQHVVRPRTAIGDQLIADIDPQALEVHPAVLAAPDPGGYPFLPTYLSRAHDAELRSYLKSALQGGVSVLVMLTGDSATGKTRALYEALGEVAPHRRLLRPSTSGDLLSILLEGRFEPDTVLWLNESQRFFYGHDAEQTAAELRRLLVTTSRLVAVGTLWTDPYWEELTRPGRAGDPHGQVRGLLDCSATRRIMVPDHLSDAELRQWRTTAHAEEEHGDRRLIDALRAGAADGSVVQHLSGGPALLAAYRSGPGSHFNHVEHAILGAALDARRLGHRSPLPGELLADAADGALHPRRRPSGETWAEDVLKALSTGERGDGRRTDIRHTLTAMHTPLSRSGDQAVYEPADYLVQHVGHQRADRPGAPSLWRALVQHTTDADDLVELGTSAANHGYLRQAALLWRKAVLAGHPTSGYVLAELLDEANDPHQHGSLWVAGHAVLHDPDGVRNLLDVLHQTQRSAAIDVLMQRHPETHVDCDDAESIAYLLESLSAADLHAAAAELAARAAGGADATDPGSIVDLLEALRDLGYDRAYRVLAVRASREADATEAAFSPALLAELTAHSPADATVLAARAIAEIDIRDANDVTNLLDAFKDLDLRDSVTGLLRRAPETHVDLSDPEAVVRLIETLEELEQTQAVRTLVDRDLAGHADLTDPDSVPALLSLLMEYEQSTDVMAVAARAASETDISHPGSIAELLEFLHQLGMEAELATLLDRDVSRHTDVHDHEGVGRLLVVLKEMDQGQAVGLLAQRAAADADATDPDGVAWLVEYLQEVGQDEAAGMLLSRVPVQDNDETPLGPADSAWGCDLDGSPAGRWTWDDLSLNEGPTQ
ncbi:helix-turn-helix domain-containing protein [Streptomyces yangpuensis]|uniref:Helix-turn-helix domain-containing protein n=1 Tax=Streptomyces yangpuensis TaxID=1648182 RepID=A0ABY5Q3Y3_9ACTN|nr:helix-turn-helix domain-containing protein [Streptomyces yangpuensis]UUY50882.1 helix-turn-helix domain-containing protein [Streptomyces yangpuensis]